MKKKLDCEGVSIFIDNNDETFNNNFHNFKTFYKQILYFEMYFLIIYINIKIVIGKIQKLL